MEKVPSVLRAIALLSSCGKTISQNSSAKADAGSGIIEKTLTCTSLIPMQQNSFSLTAKLKIAIDQGKTFPNAKPLSSVLATIDDFKIYHSDGSLEDIGSQILVKSDDFECYHNRNSMTLALPKTEPLRLEISSTDGDDARINSGLIWNAERTQSIASAHCTVVQR